MRVLQITSNDARTGGAIAVTRLHEALLKQGHESRVLSLGAAKESSAVGTLSRSTCWRALDAVSRRVTNLMGLPAVYRPSASLIHRAVESFQPDIVHIHWTYSGGSVPLSMLPALTARYPTVWTFHDMWAFTGGCTNSLACMRWRTGCGACPQQRQGKSDSMMPLSHDTTHLLWMLKSQIFSRSRFAVLGPSTWMVDLVNRSPIMAGKRVYHVLNGLDTDVWRPLDRDACRVALGIPRDAWVILFVGKPDDVFAYSGRRRFLIETLRSLRLKIRDQDRSLVLLLVGDGGDAVDVPGFMVVPVGAVRSPALLRLSYGAADLLIDPTQFDNLPGVVQEAMACGLPVVASNVGGLPDLLRSGETGYLVRCDAPEEFAEAISRILRSVVIRQSMSECARDFAMREFHSQLIVARVFAVYEKEIADRSAASPRDGDLQNGGTSEGQKAS